MKIAAANLRPEGNNFVLVRLILASSVIFSHSYQVLIDDFHVDPLSPWLGAPVSYYAVDGFFFLSGFLVYPSLLRLGGAGRFLGARVARLWPGLALSILITVFAGAFATDAAGFDYLKGATARFVGGNLSFVKAYYTLTGVRCGGAACDVNGSLWSLPWEARCYLALALLGLDRLASPKALTRIVFPLTLAFALAWDTPLRDYAVREWRPGAVFALDLGQRLWPLFCLGALAYVHHARIPLSWLALAALLALTVVSVPTPLYLQARALFVGYAVLCCGVLTTRRFQIPARAPDYSYGMYIYGYPVMLLVGLAAPGIGYLWLWLATTLLTLPCAALSWHGVEKPALEGYKGLFRPGGAVRAAEARESGA